MQSLRIRMAVEREREREREYVLNNGARAPAIRYEKEQMKYRCSGAQCAPYISFVLFDVLVQEKVLAKKMQL